MAADSTDSPGEKQSISAGIEPSIGGVGQPGLTIVATPIGNLGDITHRAVACLKAADAIACEDTRLTRRLLQRYDITTRLISYHDHNAAEMLPKLLARLNAGERLCLVSDAGTPLISDPGYRLVSACRDAGIAVTSAPGPSALTAALSIAGLPTDRFLFAGFLPAKAAARRKALAELLPIAASLVLYEAPQRLAAAVQDIAAADPERQIALCRELTKRYEEVRRADAARLAADLAAEAPPKGEIVLILGPPQRQAQQPSDAEIDARLIALTAEAGVREAAATLAAETGMPRRKLYSRAQALKDGAGS